MKKLVYVVIFVAFGFVACEQENIEPAVEAPVELLDPTDGGEDEEQGDRPSGS